MPAGKDGKSVPENPITPGLVHFAVAAASEANSGTPASLTGDIPKNLPKTSTPYPIKENPDHQLSISRIVCTTEQALEHKDGPAAKRRREVVCVYNTSHVTVMN